MRLLGTFRLHPEIEPEYRPY